MKRLLASFLAVFPMLAGAQDVPAYGTPEGLRVTSAGHVHVMGIAPDAETPTTCESTDAHVLPAGHDAFDAMYSLLISAWASGREIGLTVEQSACSGGYPVIKDMVAR